MRSNGILNSIILITLPGEENTPSAYLLWYEMIADDEAAMIRELAGAGPANGTTGAGAGGPQTPAAEENGIEEDDDDSYQDTVDVPEEDLLIPDECMATPGDDESMAARDRRAAAASGDCAAAPSECVAAPADAMVPLAQLARQLQYQAQYRRQYELLQRAKDESEWWVFFLL